MPRPRLVTDEQILSTARACVLELGPQVSLDVVADRLGISQPALHKRFGDRRTLMLAALVPAGEPPWIREIAGGPDERPLRAQLEELLGRVSAYLVEIVPCLSALHESGIPRSALLQRMKSPPPVMAMEAVARWLTQAKARGLVDPQALEPESVAAAMLGPLMAHAHVSHMLQRSWVRRGPPEFVADVAELFSRALVPASAPSRSSRKRPAASLNSTARSSNPRSSNPRPKGAALPKRTGSP